MPIQPRIGTMTPPTFQSLRDNWPRFGGSESLSMSALARRLTSEDPLVIPDYQRTTVWSDDQCARFIGFLAGGGSPPPVFVQRWAASSGKPDEILDGLQRITAIRRFLENEVPMELTGGMRVFLRDMDPESQRLMTRNAGPTLSIRYVLCETRAAVLDLYLRINRGGTPHSDADIDRVVTMRAMEG